MRRGWRRAPAGPTGERVRALEAWGVSAAARVPSQLVSVHTSSFPFSSLRFRDYPCTWDDHVPGMSTVGAELLKMLLPTAGSCITHSHPLANAHAAAGLEVKTVSGIAYPTDGPSGFVEVAPQGRQVPRGQHVPGMCRCFPWVWKHTPPYLRIPMQLARALRPGRAHLVPRAGERGVWRHPVPRRPRAGLHHP